MEAAPELPLDPQPAQGSLTAPAPAAAPPAAQDKSAGSPAGASSQLESNLSVQTVALQKAPRSDPAVRTASFKPPLASLNAADTVIDRDWKQAGRAAARVGDEVITLHDLVLNVREEKRRWAPGRSLSPDETNILAKHVLAGMIERTLICQEAKRVVKDPKQLDHLYKAADQEWRENELPPLMRRYSVDNQVQLAQKMLESGRSLEALHQTYRQEFLAQVFMYQKLKDDRNVGLPEMLEYYSEHYRDKEFHRPAQITWREIVIEKSHYPNPADARRKAEALLARLRNNEDMATLARAESEGPSRVRAQGGLMQTSPGSYAVEAVNQALAGFPLNQVSPILEGPTSLHILKVENRRPAGPASFEEVQDEIRKTVMAAKLRKAQSQFLTKLKQNTLVTTIFDGTKSDPNTAASE
ncbi:MAG: peptidylprolyl isomerase [Isosphaeraceae bacterium]